jgi:RNA polymerase sigma factor (sigma-70 family)
MSFVRFETTSWSVILKAASGDDADARLALALLCEAYWYPVYAYIRRQGSTPVDAEDLTQAYFARFLDKKVARDVRPERGRFRTFLLVSVRNFLHNERDKVRARKRGGDIRLISLDAELAEGRLQALPVDTLTPEVLFERSWALTVVERVRERLLQDAARRGTSERTARLYPYLTGAEPEGSSASLAREWGVSETAVRVALHRLRQRFGRLLREEIARTVEEPADIDDEVRRVLAVLGA